MLKPYLELCRISNLPTVWTNVFAAMMISGVRFSWPAYLPVALSMSLFYCGGMGLNDICDAETDSRMKPTRPIPSGRISIRAAAVFAATLFVLGIGLLLFAPYPKGVLPGIALVFLIILYDRHHKQHPASVLLMAGTRFLVFVVTAVAVTGSLGTAVTIAGGLQFLYVLLISIVARHENRRGIPFRLPLIPIMIAFISVMDASMIALFGAPGALIAAAGAVVTLSGQTYVRGD